jgi:colanic acid/amylovoran biosynthesis glycosyltransferase
MTGGFRTPAESWQAESGRLAKRAPAGDDRAVQPADAHTSSAAIGSKTRVAYLFTTFPVDSETFLQREIRAMRERTDIAFELHSMWGGADSWEDIPVRRFPFAAILRVIFWQLPKWAWRKPGVLLELWSEYLRAEVRSPMNVAENMLGLAFALDRADYFNANKPDLFHGVWATMPGSAGLLLSRLTGVPYSLGAHAYDIFARGGDWIAKTKLRDARFVHNSTGSARTQAMRLGCSPEKAALIRRGLDTLPDFTAHNAVKSPVKILTVGRLVPKKGFRRQLKIHRALIDAGIDLRVTLVGEGDLHAELVRTIARLGLENHVRLAGKLTYAEVSTLHDEADIFIFTGLIAEDGDRDGLPNVIGEAMAHGTSVITTPVSGTTEAIECGVTGQVVPLGDTAGWIRAVRRLIDDPEFTSSTRRNARRWVEENFCAHGNAAKLAENFRRAVAK